VLTVHGVTGAKLLQRGLFEVVVLERRASRVAMLVDILGEVEILGLVEA